MRLAVFRRDTSRMASLRELVCAPPLNSERGSQRRVQNRDVAMPEPAADAIVRNLIEALERLRNDLDRMELWAAALDRFQDPVPDYEPGDQHLLDPESKARRRRPPL